MSPLPRPFRYSARIAALLLASVLAACATPAPSGRRTAENLPADPNALVLGAEMALQRGQYLEASQAYLRAAQASNDEELAEQATRVAHEHRQWTVVQASAERWLELNHTNEEARRFAAFAALHLYRVNTAAEHLGILLDTAFINPQAGFLALLPQLADEGTPSGATAVLRQLIVKYPDVTEAHYALAQAASQSDNLAAGDGACPQGARAGAVLVAGRLAAGSHADADRRCRRRAGDRQAGHRAGQSGFEPARICA